MVLSDQEKLVLFCVGIIDDLRAAGIIQDDSVDYAVGDMGMALWDQLSSSGTTPAIEDIVTVMGAIGLSEFDALLFHRLWLELRAKRLSELEEFEREATGDV